jgi:PAS domain S-box-containing protein
MSFLSDVPKHINLGALPVEHGQALGVLAHLVEHSTEPIWVFSKDLEVVYDNRASWNFGTGQSDVGASVDKFSPEVADILREKIKLATVTGNYVYHEGWLESKVLGRRFLRLIFLPLPHGMVAVMPYDLTENKLVEDRLHKSEERVGFFAEILERSAIPFAAAHPDTRLITFNRAFQQISGLSEAELNNQPWNQRLTLARWQEHEARCLRKLYDTLQPQRYELEIGGKQRDAIPVEVTVQAISTESGQPKYIFAFFSDITERKRVHSKLLQDQREESMTTIAGGIAHDFNNILTGVMGAISLIQENTGQDSPLADWTDIIATAADRMSDMTSKLLTYSRGGQMAMQAISPAQMIRDALKMARSSLPGNVNIQLELPKDLAMVIANPGQLNQVLLNLIINAGEAMQSQGGVLCIRAWNELRDQDWTCMHEVRHHVGRYVHVEASDTGHGMDKSTLSRIFEPFYSTKADSRGLGLAASLNIVKDMGGCLTATSRQGHGSTFHLLLPQAEVAGSTPEGEKGSTTGEELTILLIEDNDIVRRTMSAMLRERGHRVIIAGDGPDGLGQYRLRFDSIDLVILDAHMPVMNGAEVFKHMRLINPAVKVLVCSAHDQDDALRDFGRDHVSGFLQKPYRADQLANAVREAVADPSPAD